jgi:putative intracellular protease/amidase
MTAAREQVLANGEKRATGYFLNEFYEAYRSVRAAGHPVVFASPGGRIPEVDPESLHEKYWKDHPAWLSEAKTFVDADAALHSPLPLEHALERSDELQGLVVPGGQGVMVDLLTDENLHALVLRMSTSHRPIGLICHAPAILTRLPVSSALAGREVTSVSWLEELFIETFVMGAEASDRDIGEQLTARGFRHVTAFPGSAHAVRDCNLVTSQNPFSGGEFNQRFLAALADYRRGGHCTPADG